MAVPADRPISGLPTPLPALLTVEEAALLLRIGRTKAYAMTRQWRDTGGQVGLPVVDFDNVLRVPVARLEQMLGVSFSGQPLIDHDGEPPAPQQAPAPQEPAASRRHRRSDGGSTQLGLFGPAA